MNEVYYTRTRDNIHVVYRRSRVGEQPHADPLFEQGRRIRQHGHNSPFEEIAIAQWLRRAGVPTAHPRAIYRTGHRSTRDAYVPDDRRFASHAGLFTPGPGAEPILSPSYDYYTIWGYYRGIDPDRAHPSGVTPGVADLESALDAGVIDEQQREQVLANVRARLTAIGLDVGRIQEYEFAVPVAEDGTLCRNQRGEVEARLCIDALTAYEHGLLNEESYRELIERSDLKLKAVGCEKLDLRGDHLLLSMDPDGRFQVDVNGEAEVVLSNFEFIRSAVIEDQPQVQPASAPKAVSALRSTSQ